MKKAILVSMLLIATLVAATTVLASDTAVSLGVKLWSNAWKETVKPAGGGARDYDNGTVLMAGPSLNVRYAKDWFADITYLKALGDYESSDWFASGDKMKFDRTDMDAMAGYLLHDPFNDVDVGFFVAYKMVDAPASYTNQAAGLNNADIGTWRLWGPGLGVLVEKHLDDATLLYGNVEYLYLQEEFSFSSGGVSRFDTSGWSTEVAVAHSLTKKISFSLGVKYQRFKGWKNNGNDDAVTDTFSGLTAGIAYTF